MLNLAAERQANVVDAIVRSSPSLGVGGCQSSYVRVIGGAFGVYSKVSLSRSIFSKSNNPL